MGCTFCDGSGEIDRQLHYSDGSPSRTVEMQPCPFCAKIQSIIDDLKALRPRMKSVGMYHAIGDAVTALERGIGKEVLGGDQVRGRR